MRITILLLTLSIGLNAQGVSHSSVVSAAAEYAGQEIELTWAIGEPFVEYFSAPGASLSQGFHQDPAVLLDIDQVPAPSRFSVSVYPNPARDRVSIRLDEQNAVRVHVVDILGRERAVYRYDAGAEELDVRLAGFEPGMYLLHIVPLHTGNAVSRLLRLQP